jgi:hypothetical protein
MSKSRLSFGDAASSFAVFNGFPSFLLGVEKVLWGGLRGWARQRMDAIIW